jgi:hypothetical protein
LRSAIRFDRYKTGAVLVLLAAGALLVHGYHPYAEDAEIYLPGVEKILDPQLFPSGQEFFASHAHLTSFPDLIAFSLRVTHLPFEVGIFCWHIASIFLLLLACWELSGVCFSSARARWGGVCLVAALLTIPVAGTALYIVDQYLNPRNLAAFAGVFAVAKMVRKKYLLAAMWLVLAACVHPLMWVFPFSWCALWVVLRWMENRPSSVTGGVTGSAGSLLLGIPFVQSVPTAYHDAAKLHSYFYIQRWEWYEWLGILGPVVLFWWFGRMARSRRWQTAERVAGAFVIYVLIYVVVALVIDVPASFEGLARLQPMRSLHLLYIVLFVFIGGFLGEYVLRDRVWRWLVLFVPLSAGMFFAQRALFPASAHVEWPGSAPKNPWMQAFVWARANTPRDAVFALDPQFLRIEGEDATGFRCVARRSRLADAVKDNGVVSMFPPLANEWLEQVRAQTPWKNFQAEDFSRLKAKYGVSWVVLQGPGVAGLDCGYENAAVRVCRVR